MPKAAVADLEDVPRSSPEDADFGGLLYGSDDPVPDPVRVFGPGPRTSAHYSLCRHRASHRRVDGPPAPGSFSLGQRPKIFAARSGSDLWRGVCPAGKGDGHPAGPFRPALSVAARVCRTGDRYDPPRMPGSPDCLQRAKPVPVRSRIPGLLSSKSYALGTGER